MKVVRIKINKEDKEVFKIMDQYSDAVIRYKRVKMPKPYTLLAMSDGARYISFCVQNIFEMLICKHYFKNYNLEIEP